MKDLLDGLKVAVFGVVFGTIFLAALYLALIIGGVIAHWLADIFMFGWRLV